nr:YdhR family protein [Neisseria weixii]
MFILQVDFPYQGPWGEEMAAGMKTPAESIAQEPGLIWKF